MVWRLAGWYALSVGSISILPFLAVVLTDAGLDAGSTAAVMALLPAGILVGAPLWAWAADRSQRAVWVLRLATALAVVAGALLSWAPTATFLVAGIALLAMTRGPVGAIADALTVQLLGEQRRRYGQIRAIGSGVFLVAVLMGGSLREVWPRAPIVIGTVLLGGTAMWSWVLPSTPAVIARPTLAALRLVLSDRRLRLLMITVLLHGIALAGYDSLFSLHVESLGLSPSVTGRALALGVAVEIGVLAAGSWLLERFGLVQILWLGVAVGVPRFLVTGLIDDPTVLVAVQALHGLHFGAFWIAGVALFSEAAPRNLASSVQALLPASSFGAGYLISMLGASWVLQLTDTSGLFLGLAGVSVASAAVASRAR